MRSPASSSNRTEQFHPQIAVILNITPDHLDRHGTFENYARAKERIFAAQDRRRLRGAQRRQRPRRSGRPRAPSPRLLVLARSLRAPGRLGRRRQRRLPLRQRRAHRAHPPAAARSRSKANTTSKTFSPRSVPRASPEHPPKLSAAPSKNSRPSSIASNSSPLSTASSSTTTPRPPTSMPPPRPSRLSPRGIHLILGGKDKNSDYTQLSELLREHVRAVYTIGSAAAKIESQLRGVVSLHSCETLDKAVTAAATAARPSEVVLLAPACSSSISSKATSTAAASLRNWSTSGAPSAASPSPPSARAPVNHVYPCHSLGRRRSAPLA